MCIQCNDVEIADVSEALREAAFCTCSSVTPHHSQADGGSRRSAQISKEATTIVTLYITASGEIAEELDIFKASAAELGMSMAADELESNKVSATKLGIPTSFEILYQSDIWIYNTGASSHSTNNRSGAKNQRDSGSPSLGHDGQAVEATSTIDLPGQFLVRDGSFGMEGVLTEVNYNNSHNFNLMSFTRLLCKGWRYER